MYSQGVCACLSPLQSRAGRVQELNHWAVFNSKTCVQVNLFNRGKLNRLTPSELHHLCKFTRERVTSRVGIFCITWLVGTQTENFLWSIFPPLTSMVDPPPHNCETNHCFLYWPCVNISSDSPRWLVVHPRDEAEGLLGRIGQIL